MGAFRVIILMATSSPWSRLVASSLSTQGAEVHVVDFTPANASEYLNSTEQADALQQLAARVHGVHRLPMRGSGVLAALRAALKLRGIARECRADSVLTLYGGTSALIAFLGGVRPYLVYVVGSDVLLADLPRRLMSRFTLGRAARVLANGKHLAAKAADMAPRANVRNLYLGIDLTRFQPRGGWTVAPTFVCTRVFRPVYDNLTIIRAVGAMAAVPPDFRMAFLSAGPMLDEARAMARSLPADRRDAVRFGGWASDEAFAAGLGDAAFYVSASLSDGSSSSLMEAMAVGLIPIVSDIPANREWIVNGENGLLFPPGDDQALAQCLRVAIEGRPWMAAAIEENRRLVTESADARANMQELFHVLRAHAATNGGGRN